MKRWGVKWFKEINSEELDISPQRQKSLLWELVQKTGSHKWILWQDEEEKEENKKDKEKKTGSVGQYKTSVHKIPCSPKHNLVATYHVKIQFPGNLNNLEVLPTSAIYSTKNRLTQTHFNAMETGRKEINKYQFNATTTARQFRIYNKTCSLYTLPGASVQKKKNWKSWLRFFPPCGAFEYKRWTNEGLRQRVPKCKSNCNTLWSVLLRVVKHKQYTMFGAGIRSQYSD